MAKDSFAEQDGREMYGILRTAKCLARYDKISHDLLAEILVAAALGGVVEGGNRRGSDVRAPDYGRVEVKSRILGTDGDFPRVSLKPSNLEKAEYFAAVRWQRDFSFYDAVMLPKSSVLLLHDKRKQASGMAHIKWSDWCASEAKISLKQKIESILKQL